MLNGDFWILETQYEAKIIKDLQNSALKVMKRDDLYFTKFLNSTLRVDHVLNA